MFEDHHLFLNYNMNLPAMVYLVNAPDNQASNKKDRLVSNPLRTIRTHFYANWFTSDQLT